MESFKRGDKVRVVSCCQSYGQTGTVVGISSCYGDTQKIAVKLDNGNTQKYSNASLERVDSVMEINGCYSIAMVKFLQGTNTTKEYAFALFEPFCIGDIVLCDTANGYGVARIVNIIAQNEYDGTPVTKEIVCQVDFSSFNYRKEMRKKKEELKKLMDKMVADNQELILYQAVAEKNPEMKILFDEYKNLMPYY